FANTVIWDAYEAIQSDLFDHFLAVLPEFDLRLFQAPTGWDMRGMHESLLAGAPAAAPAGA
ncbi:MAG TPA: hypothetical protein PKB04_10745, partial [Phenylobacterium sp.]|nr:hypothetical protein [Phenylobacterium sp.]